MTKRSILALVILVVTALSGFSQTTEDRRKSLQGLKAVGVLDEEISPDAEQDGVTESELQTQVELKLRLAGIKVVTLDDSFKLPGQPYLYVRVSYMRTDIRKISALAIELQMKENVLLVRNPAIGLQATTWQKGVIATGGINYLAKDVHDSIDKLTDKFINDYLSVNPK